jgi:hypothetical protein
VTDEHPTIDEAIETEALTNPTSLSNDANADKCHGGEAEIEQQVESAPSEALLTASNVTEDTSPSIATESTVATPVEEEASSQASSKKSKKKKKNKKGKAGGADATLNEVVSMDGLSIVDEVTPANNKVPTAEILEGAQSAVPEQSPSNNVTLCGSESPDQESHVTATTADSGKIGFQTCDDAEGVTQGSLQEGDQSSSAISNDKPPSEDAAIEAGNDSGTENLAEETVVLAENDVHNAPEGDGVPLSGQHAGDVVDTEEILEAEPETESELVHNDAKESTIIEETRAGEVTESLPPEENSVLDQDVQDALIPPAETACDTSEASNSPDIKNSDVDSAEKDDQHLPAGGEQLVNAAICSQGGDDVVSGHVDVGFDVQSDSTADQGGAETNTDQIVEDSELQDCRVEEEPEVSTATAEETTVTKVAVNDIQEVKLEPLMDSGLDGESACDVQREALDGVEDLQADAETALGSIGDTQSIDQTPTTIQDGTADRSVQQLPGK